MRINRHFLPTIVVLLSLWFCFGAAEFPIFRMPEFDRSVTDEETFEAEIPEVMVPPVSQRLYGAEEQRRLPITSVVIGGVVPYPARDITQEKLQRLVDEKFRQEQSIELDVNGFTERDLLDIGAYLRQILARGGIRGGVDREDIVRLILNINKWEQQHGWITIEQLDRIAVAVTEYYRERGFILATAFIPEQEVSDGVIRLSVLEGRLGSVTVSNNDVFDAETIRAAFRGELGEAVTEDRIESALRRINELPGVRVRGSFSPGQNVGETSLNLGVLDETSWNSSVLMDNHGSETTGELRIFATTEWLNVRGKGHRILVGALRSEGPDSSLYGLIEYEMPITKDGRGRLKASISTNQFSVGASQTIPEIVGETDNFSIVGTYQFLLSRTLNLKVQASYTYKDVLFDVGNVSSLSTDQQIGVYSIAANYTQLWDSQQLLLSGRFAVEQGNIFGGQAQQQSTDFTKTLVNLNVLKRFSFPNWLTKNRSSINFVVKSNAQYAEQFLSSVEQFSLGGPTAVRAFTVSDVSVDSGIYAGLEVYFDLPFDPMSRFNLPLDPLKPFIFFDYAYGVARRSGGDNKDAYIKGYGLGVRISWPGKAVANLVFAKPRSAYFDDNFIEAEGESRIFFDFLYTVH